MTRKRPLANGKRIAIQPSDGDADLTPAGRFLSRARESGSRPAFPSESDAQLARHGIQYKPRRFGFRYVRGLAESRRTQDGGINPQGVVITRRGGGGGRGEETRVDAVVGEICAI